MGVTHGVTRCNTGVNDRRCAEGFVRVRGKCLGAVAKGNDVVAACSTTIGAWRELLKKKRR